MSKLICKILIKILNFFGILNLKVTKYGLLRNSKLCLIMNVAKVVIILYYYEYMKTIIDDHLIADYLSSELTKFAEIFFSLHTDYMYFNTIMFILLQIWKRNEILNVLNEMLILRSLFLRKYKAAEKLYNQIEKRCLRDVLLFFFITIGIFGIDFVCTMNHNWNSSIAYAIFTFPYVTIILMTLIAYLSIQFVAICQEILIESLSEVVSANHVEDIGHDTEELISLFCKINDILTIQVSLMIIYYLSETIVQV